MSRVAVRTAVRGLLHEFPVVGMERVKDVPSLVVSTPREEALDSGYVTGERDIVLSLEITVYEKTEDAVDEMLGRVEREFVNDPSLGGTVRDLQFSAYDLAWDEPVFIGTQTWTSVPI